MNLYFLLVRRYKPAILFSILAFNGSSLAQDLDSFSLEDLMNIQVTSVSKKSQKLSDTAAATFVITGEDIKRSGVRNIPAALRMAPGVNVDQINSSLWAVSIRGFNGQYSNKLLVMVDDHSIYDPSFSGVYWQFNDLLLEDIERIEVIRGPGGTLWGTDAVNGVINIITKHAADTQGGLGEIGVGDEEKGFIGARYGVQINDGLYGRSYLKAFSRGDSERTDGGTAGDAWKMIRAGFRLDYQRSKQDSYTFQGSIFYGDTPSQFTLISNETLLPMEVDDSEGNMSGGHLLGRWSHVLTDGSEFLLRVSYDKLDSLNSALVNNHDIFDLDFQYRLALGQDHDALLGGNYRYTSSKTTDTNQSSVLMTEISPEETQYGLLVQDEITLLDNRLWLTIGVKYQHSDLSSFGLQPSARILWVPHPKHRVWAAVSYAERSPSHQERYIDIIAGIIPPFTPGGNPTPLPIAINVHGNLDFKSEELTAWELGYRVMPFSFLSIDSAVFYNKYKNLLSGTAIVDEIELKESYFNLPVIYGNLGKAESWGFELSTKWQPSTRLQMDLAYTYFRSDLGKLDDVSYQFDISDAKHRVSFRSAFELSNSVDLDLWVRYTSSQSTPQLMVFEGADIDDFVAMDLRLSWKIAKNLSFDFVGQNLLHDQHQEHATSTIHQPSEIERGVYAKVNWKF